MAIGCGTTREKLATDQLLLSDAVDRSVANIDFSPLAHQKVYLDTQFIKFQSKGPVDTNYVVSSIRQQLVVAGCLIQENKEDATYIVEARVGTLGSDQHDINYGVPASHSLNAAASLVSSTPLLPVLPEISLARKSEDMAAAKVAVFAYHREDRHPVWQSGTSVAKSQAKAKWFLGAGPFQSGTIYEGTHFAGNRLKAPPKLFARDNTYREQRIWDEDLRRRVAAGEHLRQPSPPMAARDTIHPPPPPMAARDMLNPQHDGLPQPEGMPSPEQVRTAVGPSGIPTPH